MAHKLLIHSARQVVLVAKNGEKVLGSSVFVPSSDEENGQIGRVPIKVEVMEKNGTDGISLVVGNKIQLIQAEMELAGASAKPRFVNVTAFGGLAGKIAPFDGLIKAADYDSVIQQNFADNDFSHTIDASGLCVLPGLVDGHTHPVWAGDRVHEFAMKLAGATYMDVHKAGGGINFTVEHTRKASEDELFESFKERLNRMLDAGTTLVECKTGYGLDWETELKMLRVIDRAKNEMPIEVSSTYCGAHSVPKGSTAAEATDDIVTNQIPRLKSEMDNGQLHVDNVDVFCEKGVFDVDQSRRILEAGKEIGLNINFHGDELNPQNSAEMGASIGSTAISHLEEISDAGIDAMATAGCVATILPTTAYILRLKPPPVRKMIERGVPVALGSDFNPNAFCLAMPLVMHLACVMLGLSMDEALVGATLHAAASLGKADTHGSIEVGKVGDFIILDAPRVSRREVLQLVNAGFNTRWEHLIYQMAEHHHVIKYVIKKGVVVREKK